MPAWPRRIFTDILASLVVFLVALPLCLGVAQASGMPEATGLITGVLGGIVVGLLAGSPLQVSGPAAGLFVLVAAFVEKNGIAMLGPVIVLAGSWSQGHQATDGAVNLIWTDLEAKYGMADKPVETASRT
jgi:MFS superfamily sulfate permease-like transporter